MSVPLGYVPLVPLEDLLNGACISEVRHAVTQATHDFHAARPSAPYNPCPPVSLATGGRNQIHAATFRLVDDPRRIYFFPSDLPRETLCRVPGFGGAPERYCPEKHVFEAAPDLGRYRPGVGEMLSHVLWRANSFLPLGELNSSDG